MPRRNIWEVALRALFLTLGVGAAGWGALVFQVFWQQLLVGRNADRVADGHEFKLEALTGFIPSALSG